jgi:predicted nucleotidyltransferase
MNPLELVESILLNTPYKAVLFGSRANGTSKQNSDWDIALIGPSRIDPILLMNIEVFMQ